VKVGIRDRTSEYIVSENSWPLFLYEGYAVNANNLEQGLFKSKVLVQVSGLGRSCSYTHGYGATFRLSKLYSPPHLPPKKLMEMEMEPILLRTTGALDGN
jgi:hypothetical protein